MIPSYKKYIHKKYFYSLIKVTFVFFSISVIMNLFEEINFLKDSDNVILLPLYLTILNTPSILFEIFPFIILISCLFFYMEIIDKDELVIYKLYGLTNLEIIKILCIANFFVGIFLVLIFYNISASLKFFYLDLKNNYAKDDKYLAVVTSNGLWIRDEVEGMTNFISADKIENKDLLNISISQFDENFNLDKTILADSASIVSTKWILKDVIINTNNNSKKVNQLEFDSNFDHKRILSIFENFSSLNIIELEEIKKDYKLLGYNTNVLDGYKHKLYSYPIYLTLMACIASLLMLQIRYKKSKVFHITLGILISVIIYYISYFFKVIIQTQNVPYILSIWGPQLILIMIVSTNLIKINEK